MEAIVCDISAFRYWRVPPIVRLLAAGPIDDSLLQDLIGDPSGRDSTRPVLPRELAYVCTLTSSPIYDPRVSAGRRDGCSTHFAERAIKVQTYVGS